MEGLAAAPCVAPGEAEDRDLEHEARVGYRRSADVDDRTAENLDPAREQRPTQRLRHLQQPLGLVCGPLVGDPPAAGVEDEGVAQSAQEVVGDLAWRYSVCKCRSKTQERSGAVLGGERIEDRDPPLEEGVAESVAHALCVEVSDVAQGERLVEQGEGVACRSRCASHDDVDHLVVGLDAFAAEYVDEMAGELVVTQQRELEVLRARPDGGEHLAGVGRGEHEHDVLGWLLEGLQQGVRGCGAQHVHLVDDVDLATRGCSEADADALDEVADCVDPVVRGGV
ncbi:MAG: hypothetical protein M5T61_06035 [Acidimicrobiia bacterium]|nr:hypothetical protein [Acidimicrobiia bacterium]